MIYLSKVRGDFPVRYVKTTTESMGLWWPKPLGNGGPMVPGGDPVQKRRREVVKTLWLMVDIPSGYG